MRICLSRHTFAPRKGSMRDFHSRWPNDHEPRELGGPATVRDLSQPRTPWTQPPMVLFLTSDPDLEFAARSSAESIGYILILGRNPGDGARLLADNINHITAVVVDLDKCRHGAAWLAALASLSRKIPAIAASRIDPRFLMPLAQRHGVEHWLSKPIHADKLARAIRGIVYTDRLS